MPDFIVDLWNWRGLLPDGHFRDAVLALSTIALWEIIKVGLRVYRDGR